jgi:hypothetical protein
MDATANGAQTAQLVAFPGFSNGAIAGFLRSNNLYSTHFDFQEVVAANGRFRLETLLGYRFLRFSDTLEMDQVTISPGVGGIAQGTQIVTSDRFTAGNSLHGVEFGTRAEMRGDHWSAALLTKIAVGNVHRLVGIAGNTQVTVPGVAATAVSNGGLLALSSNSGVFGSSDWVFVPEVGLNFGWDVTPHIRLGVNYSFLYWTDVARASNQVNLNINPNLFPPAMPGATPRSPTFELRRSDIWAQSLGLGLELRF